MDGWKGSFTVGYSFLHILTVWKNTQGDSSNFQLSRVPRRERSGHFEKKQDLTNLVIWRPGVGKQHFFTVNFLSEKNLEIENFYIIEKNVLPSIFIQNLIAPQTLVKIVIFSIFCAKKLKKCKKVTNLMQNLVILGIKQSTSVLVQTSTVNQHLLCTKITNTTSTCGRCLAHLHSVT